MIEERAFQKRLADLIARSDKESLRGTREQKEQWDDEWLELMYVASPNQQMRMEKLLVLHMRNRGL